MAILVTTDRSNSNPNNNINDHLHLASSDHPGMVLTNTPFNGGNFLGWSRNVKMALGSCPKPVITDENSPYEEAFLNLNGLPVCNYGKMQECTCVVFDKFLEMDSHLKLIQFLMKLNDEYESVKSQILAMDPLPNAKFSMLEGNVKQPRTDNRSDREAVLIVDNMVMCLINVLKELVILIGTKGKRQIKGQELHQMLVQDWMNWLMEKHLLIWEVKMKLVEVLIRG
ncbi:reverse transcriptase, RNA-dependent DNA polymerase [Tanacetum coccineum]